MTSPEFNFPNPPSDGKEGMKCVFCGSGDLIQGVKLLDQTYGAENAIKLGKDAHPEALLFRGRERSHTVTVVCGRCGFVHLFATSPAVLKRVGG